MVYDSQIAYSTIVFDFDGTLVDSAEIKKTAFMTALGAGVSVDPQECEKAYATHGTVNRTGLLALSFADIRGRPPEPAEHQALVDAYTAYFRRHMDEVVVFPGLPEFAARFADRRLMISSNAPRTEIVELCDKLSLSGYLSRIYGYPVSKEAALREILADYALDPAGLLYVGDRYEDGLVAEKVGVPFRRLDPGFHSTSASIVRSLGELADAIDRSAAGN
ncbi:HAD family hydrolase [Phytohabitans suffuscus]|uniref:Phosphoglycolate phosphatase, bacterial n=1 Tax=Phytohabitans suffuscus TaxID=624315 RepID=A0A6F8YCF4_9ACTN|nr:HAD family hydrolase [Phytohabitans suffuscus]BCB83713.1 phosphoglycolate phosphatase, bacterial [Phytohabitans suffuscus]